MQTIIRLAPAFFLLATTVFANAGCSVLSSMRASNDNFKKSGTIILSRALPTESVATQALSYTPVLGYFPPSKDYLPADNEAWVEILSDEQVIKLYGEELVKTFNFQGAIGDEQAKSPFVFNKVENPLWEASDNYFLDRGLEVPANDSPARKLRGALGNKAIYASSGLVIHNSIAWSKDVGGINIDAESMNYLFQKISRGTPVVIR